jgi:hypothetical protein
VSLAVLAWLIASLIQFAVGFDFIKEDKAAWDHVTAGFVLLAIALQGLPFNIPIMVSKRSD